MTKTCRACGADKPTSEFHKDRSKSDGLNLYCKPCTIAKQREFQKRPPRRKDPDGFKTCPACKTLKPSTDFYANAATWDGLQKRCATCMRAAHESWRVRNLDKAAADARSWRANNRDRSRDHSLKSNYGLPIGAYAQMLADQGGRCAICGTTDTGRHSRFHVDHCHDTGAVRALLCNACNLGIGHFAHDIRILKSAIDYLDRYPKEVVSAETLSMRAKKD